MGRLSALTSSTGIGVETAADVPIVDAGAYFDSTEVEGALQEAGAAAARINTVAPGWYVPAGSLDRWLLSPDLILRVAILGDSVMQDTVSQADGWPNRLARGIGGLRSDDVISSGAGYYHLLRHGGQHGAGNTAYEWWRCGPVSANGVWNWTLPTNDYDLCLYNTWTITAPGSGTYIHRQVTDGATTANSRTVTSATGAFDATADIGALIKSTNLPANTFIVKRNSSTSVEVSNPATATSSGQTMTIMRGVEVFTCPLSAKPGQRMRFDAALTSGDATLTSATAVFTSADVGSSIAGTGIPAGTTIASYTSATSVEMSANASATVTDGLLIVAPKGGRAVVDAVTNGTNTLTSAGAAFTPADIGKRVTGTNIANDTYIASLNSATSVVLSRAAQASATGGNLIIADKTAPPVAELGIVYIGDSGNGTGFSYSIDGGANFVRVNPTSHASDPAHLYLTNVAVTNPTTLILRNQDGTGLTASSSIFKPAGVVVRRTAAATRGLEILNLGIDGAYLKTATRSHNLGTTTSASITSGSTAITIASAPLTTTYYTTARPITGPGIPAGTTVIRNGADTAGTLSQAATSTGTVTISTFVTQGDNFAMLDNTIGLGSISDSDLWQGWRPQLIIVGYSNDYLDHASIGENGYVNFLRRVRERTSSYADMLVWIYYEQGGSRLDGTQCTGTDQSDYRAAIEAWCVSEGVAYFNAYRAFDEGEGLTGYADISTAGYLVDTLHLDQPGSDNVSARLRRGLTLFG